MLICSPETSRSAESVEALTIDIGWRHRPAGYGRECEVTNGCFVEFRLTKSKSSATAGLEKAEWRFRVDLRRTR